MSVGLIHAYIFRKICLVSDEIDETVRSMRTKKELYLLSDKLKMLETRRLVLIEMYEELKPFISPDLFR